MIKYELYKNAPLKDNFIVYGALVEKPHDHLSTIFEGTETSEYIQGLIEGIENIITGNPESSYSIENQSGFIGYAFAPDASEAQYPEGGFQVFDFFDLDDQGDTKLLYTLSLEDIIKLLRDFKDFLVENGR